MKKYQVFISSTYTDLKEERLSVTNCLLANDCFPIGMEQFPASSLNQMDYIKKEMDKTDYYIIITVGKYGTEFKDGKSYTEAEYEYARQNKIPIFCFIHQDIGQLPSLKVDDNKDKIIKFHDRLKNECNVNFYSSAEDLKARVITAINKAIIDTPARGWVRFKNYEEERRFIQNTIKNSFKPISSEEIDKMFEVDNKKNNDNNHNLNDLKFKGTFSFDYSNNNGVYIIGENEFIFNTKWTKASNTAIHAYDTETNINSISLIRKDNNIFPINLEACDFTSRYRTAEVGDAIIWKNNYGKYAVTIIKSIKDCRRGDTNDELTCDFYY